VIFQRAKGRSGLEIAKILNLPKSTVYDIINRFEKEDRLESIPQPGRPRILTIQDERFISRTIAKTPKISAPKITSELMVRIKKKISPETVRRVIKKNGYNSRSIRRKPLITKVNQKKRFNFAEKHAYINENFWNDVIFSDESKFNIFGSDGKQKVWRKPNTEFQEKNLTPTVKHGGGSIMVWGCFSAQGVGCLAFIDTTMTADGYIKILKDNLHQSAEKMKISKSFKFYQDNDPKHKAYKTREWMLYNCPKVLETPPQSPDINPIEHLWDYLDRKVHESPISNKNELKQRLKEEWEKIPLEYLQKLVASMPDRLKAVLKAKGKHTKY